MAEKVKVTTIMRLKVDLQCDKCYKKVKKLLCKFPQIRDQVFDKKNNMVVIMVVCCSPEKIRDKLCCKGCGVIKNIEIVEPPPPPPPPKKKPAPPPPEPEPPKKPENPPPPPQPEPEKAKEKPPPPPPPPPEPKPVPPPPQIPVCPPRVCCESCYEGRPGGPCFEYGYGGPPLVAGGCYDGYYYGRPVYDCYCGSRPPCYVMSRCCGEYLCEDNTSACTIM